MKSKNLLGKMPKKINTAISAYDKYKKTSNIIDRVNLASGRAPISHLGDYSTLNIKIKTDGFYSTKNF